MGWKKEYMDLILVPSGLFIMFVYHLHLFHKCLKLPKSTVIGYENYCRNAWVEKVLQIDAKDRGLCTGVISSTISASTFLASMSLVLSSLIGTLVASNSDNNIFKLKMIYGNTSSTIISVKYISILACFLLAFIAFLQSVRNYVHANFLFSMPNSDVPVEYVQQEVMRASSFWSLGLRAIYFAITLMLWIFGPIPFFASCVIMVCVLHVLDSRTPVEFHDFSSPEENLKSHNLFGRIVENVSEAVEAVVLHHHDEGSFGNGSQIGKSQPDPATL